MCVCVSLFWIVIRGIASDPLRRVWVVESIAKADVLVSIVFHYHDKKSIVSAGKMLRAADNSLFLRRNEFWKSQFFHFSKHNHSAKCAVIAQSRLEKCPGRITVPLWLPFLLLVHQEATHRQRINCNVSTFPPQISCQFYHQACPIPMPGSDHRAIVAPKNINSCNFFFWKSAFSQLPL